ncbi:Hsp70 family protein [Microbacterium hatanonis]|uniref:Hsp70 family protein n=2 Tax=Microbacterium hatanonis TaxID=404366 RepID=A0A5C8HWI5_9MICO|nr:Hsp70 family protein [Microbacterium hatanonis]
MRAPYFLAIDVGMTRTAAAVSQHSGGMTTVTSVPLGRHSDHASTAVFVGESGLLFGDAAERRGLTQPDRLIREFKRRVGDDVPVVAGDQSFTAEQLYAHVVTWVTETVIEREGRSPSAISVTVPAAWGEYRSERVGAAIAHEGWRDVNLIPEPEAAARHYDHVNPLETGRALAVYDLGGGTFDAVVVRKDKKGALRIVSPASGLSDVGGADFDDLLLRHVMTAAGISADVLATDPGARVALAALRRECVDAKESLSFDSETVIPVLLGGRSTSVRVTRAEFEAMIEAQIERTTDALEQSIESASVRADRLDAILLVGGSSRIPRVAQLLSERVDVAIAVDADPKAVVAFGAARAAAAEFEGEELPPALARAQADPAEELSTLLDDARHVPAPRPQQKSRVRWFGRGPAAAAVTVGVVVLAAGVTLSGVAALAGNADQPVLASGSGAAFFNDALAAGSLSAMGSDDEIVETPFGVNAPISDVPVLEIAAPSSPNNSAQKPKTNTSKSNTSKTPTRASGKPNAATNPSTSNQAGSNSNPATGSGGSPSTGQPSTPSGSTGGGSTTPTTTPSTPTTTPTTTPTQEPSTPPVTTPPTTEPTQEPSTPPVTPDPEPTVETPPATEAPAPAPESTPTETASAV